MKKIVVGICTSGSIRIETTLSLISNIYDLGSEGIQLGVLAQMGGYVDVNRNKLAESAIEKNMDYLMFLDGDMIFPDDGIRRLLDHDKDIIGANYNVRLDPKSVGGAGPTVKLFNKDGSPRSIRPQDLPKKLFKCYALPTGFMLIKTSVFKRLKYPYFEAYQDPDGQHHTEDIDFCDKAGKAGIDIYCDPTINMGHIGSTIY